MSLIKSFIFLLFSITLISCNSTLKDLETITQKEEIIPLKAHVNLEYCALPPSQYSEKQQVSFLIDTSGSNVSTDPSKTRRYDPLTNFINDKISNQVSNDKSEYALYQWSSSNNVWNNRPLNGVNDDSIFVDLNEISSILNIANTFTDAGGTPYSQTLANARAKIKEAVLYEKSLYESNADPYKTQECVDSVVIFISDGGPSPSITKQQAVDDVENLLSLANDPEVAGFICRITLNTAFYNNSTIPNAVDLLSAMASAGNGRFFNFLGSDPIDYNDVTQIETRKTPTEVENFTLVNESVVWDSKSNKYLADKDGDSMADIYELDKCRPTELTPVNEWRDWKYRDCDGNFVRDGAEEWTSIVRNQQCKDSLCRAEHAQTFACTTGSLPNEYDDADGDRLLNCEEEHLKSSSVNFDTANQSIVDSVKLRLRYRMAKPAEGEYEIPSSSRDADGDGISDFQEIQQMTPWNYHNDLLTEGFTPMKYTPISTFYDPNSQLNCNTYKVENIKIASENDHVCVYKVDKELLNEGKRILSVACKNLVNGSATIKRDDFKVKRGSLNP
jgi:hypothetical protein